MFLDDILNNIHNETTDSKEKGKKLILACVDNIDKSNTQTFLDSVKRTDYSWQLFCKKHNEYTPNGFRNYILKCIGDKSEVFKKALNW